MRRNYFGMLLVLATWKRRFPVAWIGKPTAPSRKIPTRNATVPGRKDSDTISNNANDSYLTVYGVTTNFVPRLAPNQKSNTKKAHR